MSICLEKSDFEELGDSMLNGFDKRVASLPPDMCLPFHEEARQLEIEILGIHKLVVLGARREDNLSGVALLWELMVNLCDASTQRLVKLVELHPQCGAQIYYDRLLDLRNKCQRLQLMHS